MLRVIARIFFNQLQSLVNNISKWHIIISPWHNAENAV